MASALMYCSLILGAYGLAVLAYDAGVLDTLHQHKIVPFAGSSDWRWKSGFTAIVLGIALVFVSDAITNNPPEKLLERANQIRSSATATDR